MDYIKKLYNIKYASGLIAWELNIKDKKLSKEFSSGVMGDFTQEYNDILASDEFLEYIKSADLLDRSKEVIYKEIADSKKVPSQFLKEMTKLQNEANDIWLEARKENDFKMFAPYLEKTIEMQRQYANYLNPNSDPYDVLLNIFEEGFNQEKYDVLFSEIEDKLVPFIQTINDSPKQIRERIYNNQVLDQQKAFTNEVAKIMEFDFNKGEISESAHPFCMGLNRQDVRITTKYTDDVLSNFKSLFHELGHARYEQNFSNKLDYTFLDDACGAAMHESQSRLYENNIACSREFWMQYGNIFKSYFDFYKDYSNEELYETINEVKLSEIRIEADELTYCLHILLRYEMEKGLIKGTIKASEANLEWNRLFKKYFGFDVSSDTNGILQDIHWGMGLIGYFPTYLLGSAISAQFIHQMEKEFNVFSFRTQNIAIVHEWLRNAVHKKGKLYVTNDILNYVTGEEFNVKYYIDYLIKKYQDIYNV